MLQIAVTVVGEQWDSENQVFVEPVVKELQLEHSLLSLSKWESKWCKPFLTKEPKTQEETMDYIRCMTLNTDVDPEIYNMLTYADIKKIEKYIEAPMTATTINEQKGGKVNREIVTSEVIYYWMVALNIPSEYQAWHLNRLLTLIRVCNIKNQPAKKTSRKEQLSQNAALNMARRKQLNSRG